MSETSKSDRASLGSWGVGRQGTEDDLNDLFVTEAFQDLRVCMKLNVYESCSHQRVHDAPSLAGGLADLSVRQACWLMCRDHPLCGLCLAFSHLCCSNVDLLKEMSSDFYPVRKSRCVYALILWHVLPPGKQESWRSFGAAKHVAIEFRGVQNAFAC